MAWTGYFSFGGNEIINVARTEAYVQSAGRQWLRPQYQTEVLPFMLGDGDRYTTPLKDDAPWVDPDALESLDFYGFYPLDVSGIEDSSRTSTVTESLSDGGIPGRLRNATKSIVFNGILLAGNDAAAEYGMLWLKKALSDGVCGPSGSSACNGLELCYLASEPDMELSVRGQVIALLDGGFFIQSRTADSVTDGGGPGSTSSDVLDGGDAATSAFDEIMTPGGVEGYISVIEVDVPLIDGGTSTALPDMEFTGGTPLRTGGVIDGTEFPFDRPNQEEAFDPEQCLAPFRRSLRRVLVNNGPTVTAKRTTSDGGVIWTVTFTAVAGNPYILSSEVPVIEGFMDPRVTMPWALGTEPDGAVIDLDGFIFPDENCVERVWDPIFDPEYPALVAPPGPPTVPLGNYNPPLNWTRRQFTVPKNYVPLWGEVVPKLQVHARTADLRNLRLRFYADPYGIGDISDDPCAYCGDIVISYVPFDHTLVMDGTEQVVYILTPGGNRRRADSLVYKTDGTPFDWPVLSCGFGFIVTLDLPQTQQTPVVDMSLFARTL